MKKIFFNFCLVFLVFGFSQNLQAQKQNCTPEQIAACKKICKTTDMSKCTVAQKKECNKLTSTSCSPNVAGIFSGVNAMFTATNHAVKKEKHTGCNPTPSSCKSAKSSVKLTKNNAPSCIGKESKVVENKMKTSLPLAQKVSLRKTN